MKPAGWPRYMRAKRLRDGRVAYYWEPPTAFLKQGFKGAAEALGFDYGSACERAAFLNTFIDEWRTGNGVSAPEKPAANTLAWLFRTYLRSAAFTKRVAKRSELEYRRALERIELLSTKDGRTAADLSVASITPRAVDRIYERLQVGPRGPRIRQANLSIDIARRAWSVVHRLHPSIVPADNPWKGVLRETKRQTKPAATREEAYALAQALKEIGEPHLGAAALICFELHQRPEHVRAGDITWQDFRPPDRPDAVQIRHPKTGAKGWVPLEHEGHFFYPELEAYLADLPRLGLPIVLTAGRRGPARPYSSEYAQRKVREARERAKLGAHVTLDACRHGGLTELGDAGVTEQEGMAASMHRTPTAFRLYVKRNEAQRRSALQKRRRLVAGKSAQD